MKSGAFINFERRKSFTVNKNTNVCIVELSEGFVNTTFETTECDKTFFIGQGKFKKIAFLTEEHITKTNINECVEKLMWEIMEEINKEIAVLERNKIKNSNVLYEDPQSIEKWFEQQEFLKGINER